MAYQPINVRFVLPALPGFFALSRMDGEPNKPGTAADVWKSPVVGWAIDDRNCTVAVTSEGVDESYHAILNPDGSVENGIGSWRSIEEWLADPLYNGAFVSDDAADLV